MHCFSGRDQRGTSQSSSDTVPVNSVHLEGIVEMSATELLLECVFSYPILYDLDHKDYKHLQKKDHIWNDIGKELNTPGDDLKKKWKNLRDTYTKYLRSIRTSTGKEKKNYKRWKWAPHMERFKPFLTMPKCETNTAPMAADKSDEIKSDLNDHNEDGQELLHSNNNDEEREFCTKNSSKRAKRSASISSVDNVVQYLQQQNKPELDAIDHFMLGFAKTIKTFSPRRQVETKMEISQLVFQKELEQIDDN